MELLFPKVEYPAIRLPSAGGIEAAYCQCTGDRPEQQDACGLFIAGADMLAAVADGMGALAKGGAAARLAMQSAEREAAILLSGAATFDAMKAVLEHINGDVYRQVDNNGVMGMAGTTLCAAVVKSGRLHLLWSGDSRAYLCRDGKLKRLTEDHVYARYLKEMVTEGAISEADAKSHPSRSHLTGYIGMHALEDYSILAEPQRINRGDVLLLCTDGLYKCIDEAQMCRCMARGAFASAQALIGCVVHKRLRGQDNASALVLKWNY